MGRRLLARGPKRRYSCRGWSFVGLSTSLSCSEEVFMWWRLVGFGLIAVAVPARAADADLAAPIKIKAGGKAIDVDGGHAAPFVADLKTDGSRYLLVGQCADGKLRLYRDAGKGKKAEPRFDSL